MGIILDSSIVIAGERRGHTVREILPQFKAGYGEIEVGVSVLTIVELAHGIERAGTGERRQRRDAFVDELIRDVPIHPVTVATARLAGSIEGGQAAHGVNIAFENLLIAATGNVRHFEAVPRPDGREDVKPLRH